MSDEDKSANSAEGKPKKLNLDALLPTKASIVTSIGTLYVRHPYSSDWNYLELDDAVELGRISVQRLCNRIEDKNDSTPLLDDDLTLLTDADCQVLVQAIAKQSGWRKLSGESGLKDLGDVIKEEKLAISERHDRMLRDLRKSIDSSYSFLSEGTLEKLQKQMACIADIRMSLAGTESIQAALRAATLPEESWRKSLAGMDSIDKAFWGKGALEKLQEPIAGIADIHRSLAGTDAIQAALLDSTNKAMRDSRAENATAKIELSRIYEAPKLIMPPRFEETPMGRATLESAENSRQVVEKMDALVVVVAGLNQTLVQDVLPAWGEKIADDQKAAKGAFDQAARGLWWTKWAVITSVLVTIAASWWQIDVAKSIDRENSEQQKRAETVLRKQLEAQQKLIEQQAKDAEAMREVVATLKQPVPIVEPKPRNGH